MFYRIANESDFVNQILDMEYDLGKDVCVLAREGKIYNAIHLLRETKGYSLQECKAEIDRYTLYTKAYESFKNGEKIYTEY